MGCQAISLPLSVVIRHTGGKKLVPHL